MGPLTDIQDNIEKLRSLQESLHDLCTFISTLDLTSGAKEDTLIHGITELKEAFANIDLSTVEQAIVEVKNVVTNIDFSTLAKEDTLIAKVAELKEALNTIDFTAIEQAIQNVENVTAREATLIQGAADIIKAVENIDFTDLENSIAEVKNAVVNIDFSAIAKEDTLKQGVQEIKGYVENIDFSAIAKENTLLVESKDIKDKIDAIEIPVTDLTEVAKENTLTQGIASISQKVDNIVIPEVDTTPLAKEDTLTQGVNTISQKIDDINIPELDKSDLAKEATLSSGISTLSNKIDNIDLSSVESKVEAEADSIEAKIDEGVSTLADKIDNIKLPEIDTTELAKQGENQDATNTAIYALLSQFGESVLQEAVTIICNCAEDIAWEEYGIVITYADGTSQSLPMSENGTCSFSVKIGQEYSVQLPVIGAYIAPTLKTYTASTSSRQIYWSYIVSGVFGLDEFGRRYTLSQIEAMDNKSIIKYGGYTDEYLENSSRDDGSTGNGFMFKLEESELLEKNVQWSSKYPTSFSTELLPFINNNDDAKKACNGEAYTRYIISEGLRTSVRTPAASWCAEGKITINNKTYNGFLPASGQMVRIANNISFISQLFNLLGLTPIDLVIDYNTSCQSTNNHSVRVSYRGDFMFGNPAKTANYPALRIFDLPR